MAEVGQVWADLDQIWAMLGRNRPNLDPEVGHTFAEFERKCCQSQPNLAKCCLDSRIPGRMPLARIASRVREGIAASCYASIAYTRSLAMCPSTGIRGPPGQPSNISPSFRLACIPLCRLLCAALWLARLLCWHAWPLAQPARRSFRLTVIRAIRDDRPSTRWGCRAWGIQGNAQDHRARDSRKHRRGGGTPSIWMASTPPQHHRWCAVSTTTK